MPFPTIQTIPSRLCLLVACALIYPVDGWSRTYELNPKNPTMVGDPKTITLDSASTLSKIAVDQQVGFDALFAANSQYVTDSVPAGHPIALPLTQILPDVKHEGIVVNLPELRLYFFHPDKKRVSIYPIGIGRSGWDTPLMNSHVSGIRKSPSWTPPASIRAAYREDGIELPSSIPPGPDNPLGSYAMRLGNTNILLHGTPNPEGVGRRVSSGCIRLYENDIAELAQLVSEGTPVQIINQPIKWTRMSSTDYLEAHRPLSSSTSMNKSSFVAQTSAQQRKATLHLGFRTAAKIGGDKARLAAERFAHEQHKQGRLFTGLPQYIPAKAHTYK